MLSDRGYNTLLRQYEADPYRLKTVQHGDGIFCLGTKDGRLTMQPWNVDGTTLCLCITETGEHTAHNLIKRIAENGIVLTATQGSGGESVHTFVNTPEAVLLIAKICRFWRKRDTPPHLAAYNFKKGQDAANLRTNEALGEKLDTNAAKPWQSTSWANIAQNSRGNA